MEGASDEQCYHLRRARHPRPIDKGLRLRAGHGRGREQVVRVRDRRARLVDEIPAPARQMRLRVGRHRLPPVPRAARHGRRLRHRRGVEDAQARRRPRPKDRPPRRTLPRDAAGARGYRPASAFLTQSDRLPASQSNPRATCFHKRNYWYPRVISFGFHGIGKSAAPSFPNLPVSGHQMPPENENGTVFHVVPFSFPWRHVSLE